MSIDIAASLNERQRDALLSYYLGQYVPASGNSDLTNLVQTPEDVYEYLLIDPLVSNAVPTARVAQAMSSIQQYINGITMNMEPGYHTQNLDQTSISNWKGGLSQYDVWAGEVELDTYPENYIDPTLRQSQTAYFKDLITDLNQNTINSDTAQQAVMNYLNKFEQVANLTIVSGYLDSADQTNGIYYLLGKSTTSPVQYYWRSFDMSQNVDNVVSTSAWSEWYPMNTAIDEEALQGIPRLTYFNNRLYLFWFERAKAGNVGNSAEGETYDAITAYSSYSDFSNNWSSPYKLQSVDNNSSGNHDAYCDSLFNTSTLCTASLYNQTDNILTVSLYDGINGSLIGGYNDFSISIDYWFNIEKIESKSTEKDSEGNDIPTLLATYLQYYSPVSGDSDAQQYVQAKFTSLFSVENVILETEESISDFAGYITLPALTKDNFNVSYNSKNTFTLEGKIPQSVNTATADIYSTTLDLLTSNGSSTICGSVNFKVAPAKGEFYDMILYTTLTEKIDILALYNPDDRSVGWHTVPLSKIYYADHGTYDLSNEKINFNVDIENKEWQITYGIGDNQSITPSYYSAPFTGLMTTPWRFQTFSNTSTDAWGASSSLLLLNISQNDFPASQDSWTYNISDFTDAELNNTKIVRYIAFGYTNNLGKTVHQEYEITLSKPEDIVVTPHVSSRTDPNLGMVLFLDFKGNFDSGKAINPIRLNTLFAKELINKASASIKALLNWDTQLTLEPGMTNSTAVPMDFSGANGIYFWELFFYMPYLVAWRLNQEQQYGDSLSWYSYIFDPSARGRDNSSDIRKQYPEPDYWSVRPLVETASSAAQATAVWLTTDPDALASASPVHYQKSVFMAYVSSLMAAADASYRLLTNDGLSLARLQYGQVKVLLGLRPDTVIVNHWEPETLTELADNNANSAALAGYEQQVTALPAFVGQYSVAADVATGDSFMAPVNSQLLGYWNTLDSRLYNLRHQLTIDGLPMTVPLYAPPVNPTILMEQSVQGGSLIAASSGLAVAIPPYRFTTMLQSTRAAVSTLSQFGQTLLSYYERQDATGLQELDTQLALNLSAYTLDLQQNAIDALDQDKTALEASRTTAQQRYDHYFALYSNGVSAGEASAMALRDSASASIIAASPLLTAGMALKTIPNIFGFSVGGADVGAPTLAAGIVLQMTGDIINLAAQQTEMSENYRRRSEEWQIQYQQAQCEVDTINAQLDALAVRLQGAVTALQLAQAQQDNLKSTLSFLTTRFTQSSLYNWLTGQLSALYYQAYDAVLSLCLSTQACWQYEMGDITSTFIQTSAWNDSYHGLLVGETLTLNLQQMESAWLSRNQRRLELTKTLSLKQLLGDDGFAPLLTDGTVSFSLAESLFDNDYPGHYLRQIKCVTVSLPTLVGPYQDVRATLTQTGSRTLLKADINGVNYLNDSTKGSAANVVTNLRASQQIAVSAGLNDSGLFQLNFGDERYLPFEGTGAVSNWQFSFPRYQSDEQQVILQNLSDVIVQVHYTAVYGGSTFEQAVEQTL
ncbi:neuraminidase-like domain-containing protein [Buttiauxella sp. HR94]|nr:neuraminidase-like domain-containing protein [Buttiauxella sp. HR94]